MRSNQKGFTLIELLVVISIIGVLSTIAMTSLNGAKAKARDAKRLSDITQIKTALDIYYADHGHYPSTGSIYTTLCDPGCAGVNGNATSTANWVPDLVAEGYFSQLPRDPAPKDRARGYGPPGSCYMYSSDGTQFILSAWATVETGPISTSSTLYSRAGFREVSIPNQYYMCDHPNIGNASWGDYYRYSYTITNVGCAW
ncbi:MAG: type II secretion system protein [Patescibacteria group bacterium]